MIVDALDCDVHEQLINTFTNFKLLAHIVNHLNSILITYIDQIDLEYDFFPETPTILLKVRTNFEFVEEYESNAKQFSTNTEYYF